MLERHHVEATVKVEEEIESLKKIIVDLEAKIKERDSKSEQLQEALRTKEREYEDS